MNILYLEDHAVFADQVARQFLTQHTVRVVPTVAAARDAFNSRTYDGVLADYDVVDGKGDDFVRECRAAQPQLPIVAVSSQERGNAGLVFAGASAVCSKMNMGRIEQVIRGLKCE